MKRWYAVNARQLLEERKRGERPAGPVSVVLTGETHAAPALYVHADMQAERLDWRMLVNLEVWLWASPAVALERVLRVSRDIAAARPARLTIRFTEGESLHDVDVGHGVHTAGVEDIPAVHEFTWIPTDLSMTPVGAKLRRALALNLKPWSAL